MRIDPEVKTQAEETFGSFGLSLSDAVNIFFHKAIMVGGMPFKIRQPRYNAETEAAIKEGRAILAGAIPSKSYASFSELLADLEND